MASRKEEHMVMDSPTERAIQAVAKRFAKLDPAEREDWRLRLNEVMDEIAPIPQGANHSALTEAKGMAEKMVAHRYGAGLEVNVGHFYFTFPVQLGKPTVYDPKKGGKQKP